MAQRSLNKVQIIGHLGRDPEVRYTASGRAVATFTVATSEQWKGQDGGDQERTEWHRVVAWGPLGEICGKYLNKGKQVYIEGRIQTREWEDQDGNKRTTVEIIARDMLMLGSSRSGGGDTDSDSYQRRDDRSRSQRPSGGGNRQSERRYDPPPPEDEIPF